MATSINWATKVITILQADLTFVSAGLYELDVDALRLELKDIEDSEEGMVFPSTHNHNTTLTLSGVTYARAFEIINGYTVTFEPTGSPYSVRCIGANHNLGDVKNVNHVSLIIGNSAGLIVSAGGGGGGGAWGDIMEGSITYQDSMRIQHAVLAGVTDIVANIVKFKGVNGTTDRVTATMTGSERTSIVLDPDTP